ncbi:MAG: SBBP repeat-containing protein, partial [Candidatus Hodarchaeota archaeon]
MIKEKPFQSFWLKSLALFLLFFLLLGLVSEYSVALELNESYSRIREPGSKLFNLASVPCLLVSHDTVSKYQQGSLNTNSIKTASNPIEFLKMQTYLPSGEIFKQDSSEKTRQPTEEIPKDDLGHSVAVDNQGNIILVGDTESANFPTLNAYDSTLNGSSDVFIAKFNTTGGLLWSTYFGGDAQEEGWDVAIDSQGNIYLTGFTKSQDFPVLNSYDDSYNGG